MIGHRLISVGSNQVQQDRRAEAMAVYRRLRQTLSVTLGNQPSPQSEALFRSIKGE